jgi:hypothetical protein
VKLLGLFELEARGLAVMIAGHDFGPVLVLLERLDHGEKLKKSILIALPRKPPW